MNKTRYCIICGEPFDTEDPEAVLCPKHVEERAEKPEVHGPKVIIPLDLAGPQEVRSPSIPDVGWKEGQVILDTYEVKGILGKGGFGQVYRVHHKSWNMDLAVKRALNLDEQGKGAFIDEAQKWIDLGLHPHIISCYYVRNIDGFPHTFAELAEGGSLESWIQREKHDLYAGDSPAVLARILDIAIQFAWGLAYAHAQGLVHQDVKPGNALMTLDGILKVTDFGLARAKSQSAAGDVLVTSGGYTPAYCSPEQAAGLKLSLKTDIWSWAVSVLEMFNGGVSWMGGQVAASALESYLGRAGEDEDIPAMPGAVADLLRACFQDDPQARPGDMAEIAERLISIYRQETAQAYSREVPKPAELRADSLNNRALSLLDLGNEDSAVQAWDSAIRSDPLHVEAAYNLGLFRWRAGLQPVSELENSLSSIKSAKPNTWRCAYLLGLVYLEKGDIESAQELLEAVDQQSPGYPGTQRALSLLNEITVDVGSRIFDRQQHEVKDIKIAASDHLVYSIDRSFELCTWNMQDGSFVKAYNLSESDNPDETSGYPRMALLEQKGQVLVSGYDDFSIKQWDLGTGRCVRAFQGHTAEVQDIDVDPHCLQVVSAGSDQTVRLWDLHTGICKQTFEMEQEVVFCVTFSSDGKRAFCAGESGEAIILSLERGGSRKMLEGHDGDVYTLEITPDGERMITGGRDGNAILWDLQHGKQLDLLTVNEYYDRSYVWTVAISPDGRLACIGDEFGRLEVWDLKRISLIRSLQGHTDAISAIAFTPGNRSLLVSSRDTNLSHDISNINRQPADWALCLPGSAHTEDVITAQAKKLLENARTALHHHDYKGVQQWINELRGMDGYAWHPEAYAIWQAAGIRAGRRIDLTAFRKVRTIENIVTGPIKISNDGRTAVIAGKSILRLYDLESGTLICKFNIQPKDIIQTVDMTQNLALAGSANGCVHIWSLDSGECVALLNESQSGLYGTFFAHSGQSVILAREDGAIDLWQWKLNPGLSINLTRLDKGVRLSGLDPVHLFAALNKDSRELLWVDLKQKALIDRIDKRSFNEYDGRLSGIENVAISPDGSRLFFKNNHLPEEQLGMWDLDNHFYAEYLLEHALKGSISPDGSFIALSRFYWNEENYQKAQGNLEIVKLQDTAAILVGPASAVDRASSKFSTAIDDDKGVVIKEFTLETGNTAIAPIAFSLDGRYLFADRENDLQVWELLWEYDFPDFQDWDEAANAYLKAFISAHSNGQGQANSPSRLAWSETDFQELLTELGFRGFGWLRPDGVRRKLVEMASSSD